MNIKSLHTESKPVEAKKFFKESDTQVLSLQILKDALLKEHTTPVPALLLCVSGEVIFENEKGQKENLLSGDYVNIEPNVLHWVRGIADAHLVLIK